MKNPQISRLLSLVLVAVVSFLPASASACAVCMGDPSTKTAGAMNGALFLMLGCVALMLSGVAAFAFHLMKRAANPLPPSAGFTSMMKPEEISK